VLNGNYTCQCIVCACVYHVWLLKHTFSSSMFAFLGICCNWWLQRTCWPWREVFKGSGDCYSRCDYSRQAVHSTCAPWLLGQQNRQASHRSL